MQDPEERGALAIGPYAIDTTAHAATFHGSPLPLGRRTVALFAELAKRPGEVVSKDALMQAVWPQDIVEEGNLTQHIYLLRKTFRDGGGALQLETVARRGYRLIRNSNLDLPPSSKRTRAIAAGACGAAAAAVLTFVLFASHPWAGRAALSPAGEQAYRTGRYFDRTGKTRTALRYFSQAIATDPKSALGYAGYAQAATSLFVSNPGGAMASADGAQAMSMAQRAVRLEPGSSEAHLALAAAWINVEGDEVRGERELQNALHLDPQNSGALMQYATLDMQRTEFRDAAARLRAALAYDPQRTGAAMLLGWDLFLMRNYSEAAAFARQSLQQQPGDVNASALLACADVRLGAGSEARRLLAGLQRRLPQSAVVDALFSDVDAAVGDRRGAREELARLPSASPVSAADPFAVATIASAYARAGRTQDALAWLLRVNAGYRREVGADPIVDPIRSEPWFKRWTRESVF